MVGVRALSDAERDELRRRARHEVGRVSERVRMILLSSKGYSVPEIAAIFDCGGATVRRWIERFDAEGIGGLLDRPRSGRPPKADAVARETIRQQLEGPPAAWGYLFGSWTIGTLTAHCRGHCGLAVSPSTMRRIVRGALGWRWNRPRHVLPDDPDAPAALDALRAALAAVPAEAAVLYEDECEVHLLPTLRATWMPRGRQMPVMTPGKNQKRALFGALEPATGRWLYLVTERKRATEFLAMLEMLIDQYGPRPLMVVLDNMSIHKARAVDRWLAAHPWVLLVWLPRYSGHRHNLVEKVWWRVKGWITANRLLPSIDALIQMVHDFFRSFTPELALQLAA